MAGAQPLRPHRDARAGRRRRRLVDRTTQSGWRIRGGVLGTRAQAGIERVVVTGPARLGVLVCDDDPMIVEALVELLEDEPGLDLVGTAGTTEEAISLAYQEKPDVILLDVRFPGTGTRAARELRKLLPDAKIVAFSAHHDQATIAAMLSAGADQFLVKGVPNEAIIAALTG